MIKIYRRNCWCSFPEVAYRDIVALRNEMSGQANKIPFSICLRFWNALCKKCSNKSSFYSATTFKVKVPIRRKIASGRISRSSHLVDFSSKPQNFRGLELNFAFLSEFFPRLTSKLQKPNYVITLESHFCKKFLTPLQWKCSANKVWSFRSGPYATEYRDSYHKRRLGTLLLLLN